MVIESEKLEKTKALYKAPRTESRVTEAETREKDQPQRKARYTMRGSSCRHPNASEAPAECWFG